MSSYRLVIDFFDHTTHLDHPSPLYPNTPTSLPPLLDTQLRSHRHLVLPRTLFQPLPATRRLNTAYTPVSPATTTAPTLPSSTPHIYSQSTVAITPTIATADLYTPAKAQTAKLDYRFGPLSVDWVDNPTPRSVPMSPTPSSSSLPPTSPTTSSSTNRVQVTGTGTVRAIETSGTTELYWGRIHLYREAGTTPEESSEKEKHVAVEQDDGRTVGLISVPGNMTAAALLGFIAPALDIIQQLRMLRDSTPNRAIVLIQFREAGDAAEFKVMYNGKPYHDNAESEICHVVSISSIKLKSSPTPPFTFPFSNTSIDTLPSDLVELPTCPVCLERMDGNVSGLIQISCTHSFHCSCLLKWGDSRCPVCRSTNFRQGGRRPTVSSSPAAQTCVICQSASNLWICLICGNVGCGRYQGGHAHSHYEDSQHNFAMELQTSRVWSYNSDEYVHRLIRNRADGMLVELPSTNHLSSKSLEDEKDKKDKGGPDRSTEESQDKIEAMGIEYAIMMTGQLELQRGYYEEEMGRLREETRVVSRKLELSIKDRVGWGREKKDLEGRVEEVGSKAKELEKRMEVGSKVAVEEEARRKKERAEAIKARKEVDRLLESERTISSSLTANLSHLRSEVAKRDEETVVMKGEMEELREQIRDVMFALTARDKIEAEGGASEMAGGSVGVVVPPPSKSKARKKKK